MGTTVGRGAGEGFPCRLAWSIRRGKPDSLRAMVGKMGVGGPCQWVGEWGTPSLERGGPERGVGVETWLEKKPTRSGKRGGSSPRVQSQGPLPGREGDIEAPARNTEKMAIRFLLERMLNHIYHCQREGSVRYGALSNTTE